MSISIAGGLSFSVSYTARAMSSRTRSAQWRSGCSVKSWPRPDESFGGYRSALCGECADTFFPSTLTELIPNRNQRRG